MGSESDVELMKAIYRAEREADRIVRSAEDAARTLVAEAESGAREALEAKRLEIARRERERVATESAETEREAVSLLERARLGAQEWTRRSAPGIDAIADDLLARILPS